MSNDDHKMQCPKCGESISIDDVLTKQIEGKIKKDLQAEQQLKEQELARKAEELQKQTTELNENKKNVDALIATKVNEKLASEKLQIFKDAKVEAEKEQSAVTAMLEEQLKNKDEKLKQATQNEIELRKEKIKLDEEKQAFELEKIRQLEEAKTLIMNQARTQAAEEQQFKIAQLEKQISNVSKSNAELTRKLEQGSQQTQGDVLEIMTEDLLKIEFPFDEIMSVPVGINGADIIQKVIDRSGRTCGLIAWETKRTKSWQEAWIQKLKDDQRAIKADIAVIVSAVLPPDVKGFMFRDGVWICDIKLIIPLATVLRVTLESVTREKALSVGKSEKMEILYNYLTGVEFRQRVEAIVEAFESLDTGLKKERIAYEKIWAERGKQHKRVIMNTVGMYGDLSGLVTLPEIKVLELGEDKDHDKAE